MTIQTYCCSTVITQPPSQRGAEVINSDLSKSFISVQPSTVRLNPYYYSQEFVGNCAQDIKQSVFSNAFKAAGGALGAVVGTALCGAGSGALIGGGIGVAAGGALAKQINDHPVCMTTPASIKD